MEELIKEEGTKEEELVVQEEVLVKACSQELKVVEGKLEIVERRQMSKIEVGAEMAELQRTIDLITSEIGALQARLQELESRKTNYKSKFDTMI
jgi:small-conductance mechanosensitive channel